MDLAEIRKEIDSTDDEILKLFLKRMELCVGVAKYKKENNMPVFQSKREEEILDRIRKESPEDIADGAGQLFTCIMDISKCLQQRILAQPPAPHFSEPKTGNIKVACPGTAGSNTEQASVKLFAIERPRPLPSVVRDLSPRVNLSVISSGVNVIS